MILQALSVCSGILGLDLAAHRHGFTTVATCEMDPDCQKVIGYYLPGAHQFSNIYDVSRTSVRSAGIKGQVALLTAGIPCQPHSVAGLRDGADDERDLWPATRETLCSFIDAGEPIRWVVVENVRGLLSSDHGRMFGGILRDLANLGYRVGWCCFGIDEAAGAPHRRDRIFIVGFLDHASWHEWRSQRERGGRGHVCPAGSPMVYTSGGKDDLRGAGSVGSSERERGGVHAVATDAGRGLGDSSGLRQRGRDDHSAAGHRPDQDAELSIARSGSQLADSEHCAGSSEQWAQSRQWATEAPGENPVPERCGNSSVGGLEPVGDSDRKRCGELSNELSIEAQHTDCGRGNLADSSGVRREGLPLEYSRPGGVERTDCGPEGRVLQPWRTRDSLGPYPPGPKEFDRWAHIIDARPDLKPALTWKDTKQSDLARTLRMFAPGRNRSERRRNARSIAERLFPLVPLSEETQLEIRRVAHGLPGRVAGLPRKSRLKMFGNGVAPDHPAEIYKFIAAECRGELLEVA